MKSIATVAVLILAVAAEGSYVPSIYAHHDVPAKVLTYAAHPSLYPHNPTVVQTNDHHHAHHYGGSWAAYAPVVTYNNHWDAHHIPATTIVAHDNQHWDNNHHHQQQQQQQQHTAAIIAPHHHSATYVSANRGAVHTAPLAGHIVSQKSLNVAPAPGTL